MARHGAGLSSLSDDNDPGSNKHNHSSPDAESGDVVDDNKPLFPPIKPPAANASYDELRMYTAQLQLRIRELEHVLRRERLEKANLKKTIPKVHSKVTAAAQIVPKELIDLKSELEKYGVITFFYHRPWLDPRAFKYSSAPLSNCNEFRGGDMTKVEVHASELFQVLPSESPVRRFIGKADYAGNEWGHSCNAAKNYFNSYCKGWVVTYIPEHAHIFKLTLAQDKTDPSKFGYIPALPCIIRDWLYRAIGKATKRSKGVLIFPWLRGVPASGIAITFICIRFRYSALSTFGEVLSDSDDFCPEEHFNYLKYMLIQGREKPGFRRLRRWIDGIVFEGKDPNFLQQKLAEQAFTDAVDDTNVQEMDELFVTADIPDAATIPLSLTLSSVFHVATPHTAPAYPIPTNIPTSVNPSAQEPPTFLISSQSTLSHLTDLPHASSVRISAISSVPHSTSSATRVLSQILSTASNDPNRSAASHRRVLPTIITPKIPNDNNKIDDVHDVDASLAALKLADSSHTHQRDTKVQSPAQPVQAKRPTKKELAQVKAKAKAAELAAQAGGRVTRSKGTSR